MNATVHRLLIPHWHPPAMNQWVGRKWVVKHRLRCQASQMLAAYAFVQGVPKARGRRRVTLTVTLRPAQRRRGCRPDPDAYGKLFLDALVQAGLLVDDAAEWVEFLPVRFADEGEWGTEVMLEDLSVDAGLE